MPGRTYQIDGSGLAPVSMGFLVLPALIICTGSVSAQDLPFKRTIPGEEIVVCAPVPAGLVVNAESRSEATRLGSTASQALILGDRPRASDLLSRATQVDPSSGELAYQYARVLEDLGRLDEAIAEYCRVLGLDPGTADAIDARARLEAVAAARQSRVPDDARSAFQQGLDLADAGRFDAAATRFASAVQRAPDWADAHFNLGVAQARGGSREAASSALQRYLDLDPDAADANAVSQLIGQLAVVGRVPSPGAALALGMIPGMGHFYSGRPIAGLTFLALAGGAAGTGLFVEDVTIRCIVDVDDSGQCPQGQVFSETSERPLLIAGLGAAAAITLIGAIEAFAKARGAGGEGDVLALDIGPARVLPPAVDWRADRVDLSLLRITFR